MKQQKREQPVPAPERPTASFVPPRLTVLGRIQDITLGTGTNPFNDGVFGS